MPTLILDPVSEAAFQAIRATEPGSQYDEVWDGVTVIMTLPNDEHQDLVMELCLACRAVTNRAAGDRVRPGINVSDRASGWQNNFRIPDAAVFLAGTSAICHVSHWQGGPDFGVEIISPDDQTRDKLTFYADVKTRELLIIDRDPWQLELYQLVNGVMVLVGVSSLAVPNVLTSSVLPLTFRLVSGERPQVEITHTATGQVWLA